ncbi:hypothetical protein H920_10859 [Fukomys damarensis]|uniref:Uncharacterized protein n=1 Tax=Fukomys damarensis TaxID=885580 RepID=A0A091DBY3_FUKDA|nr:hypothetical protein H920_10859 [Fukomys damarensis]
MRSQALGQSAPSLTASLLFPWLWSPLLPPYLPFPVGVTADNPEHL